MFTKAIVRIPGRSMVNGISSSDLGKPDYDKAINQHVKYIEALEICGLDVSVLPADEDFPDSCFVEDTALITRHCAIITNPGATSRKGEVMSIRDAILGFYDDIDDIKPPGTVEAGDIMMVEDHFYIGLSERTNPDGARQMIVILEKYGLKGSTIDLKEVLHLKTGLSYLEKGNILICGEFLSHPGFAGFNQIEVSMDEAYAANSLWVNDIVIVPAGHPKTKRKILDVGYEVIELDMSEFQKLDGGLSCLSLRF